MGFYVRKSVKAGPFRVNLSKSGIGVSTGIPGFRVGTGPRGSYVHMGRNGVSYRSTLHPPARSRNTPKVQQGVRTPVGLPPSSNVPMHDVTGSTVLELAPSDASTLAGQLTEAATTRAVWPWLLLGAWITAAVASTVPALGIVVLLGGTVLALWVRQRDKARRTVVAFFDVTGTDEILYQQALNAFGVVQQCHGAWQKVAEGAVRTTYQWKVNAGASSLVNRVPLRRTRQGPPHLATNIEVPTLVGRGRSTYLLPDGLLIQEGRRYAHLPYRNLSVSVAATRFIESERLPGDSTQVGQTWRYVNKSGGPDRRFKNNAILPIMQYAEIGIGGPSGFVTSWQLSRPDAAECFTGALRNLVAAAGARSRQPASAEPA